MRLCPVCGNQVRQPDICPTCAKMEWVGPLFDFQSLTRAENISRQIAKLLEHEPSDVRLDAIKALKLVVCFHCGADHAHCECLLPDAK